MASLNIFVLLLLLTVLLLDSSNGQTSFCTLSVLPSVLSGTYFGGWSVQDICSAMGTTLKKPDAPNPPPDNRPISASFDWRTQMSNCIPTPMDQQKCGICWGFSSATAFSSRVCIAANTTAKVNVFSPQQLLDCDRSCSGSNCQNGCNGGFMDLAWQYLVQSGDVTLGCRPYEGQQQTCRSTCASGSAVNVTVNALTTYSLSNVQDMQRSLQYVGPITVGMMVYDDFLSYSGGIYTVSSSAKQVGGHGVVLIGFGTSGGTDYWIGLNSWGTSWGENGFFRIRRGTNEATIENYAVAGSVPGSTIQNANAASSLSISLSGVFLFAVLISLSILLYTQ